jgi:hypothetical protein
MMEVVSSSETSVIIYQTTWRNIPEGSHLQTNRNPDGDKNKDFKFPTTRRFTTGTYIDGAAVAQSVQCLTTDWTTGIWSPTEAEDFSSSLYVQTGSGSFPRG